MDFDGLRQMMFDRYGDGDYRGALDVVLGAESRFPDRECDLLFWQMCLHSRLGQAAEALAAFERSLDSGHFYSGPALADPDLDPIRHGSVFIDLEGASLEAAAAASREAGSPIHLDPPEGTERRGLVVFLHGLGADRGDHLPFWSPVAAAGWCVALPRGDVAHSSSRYAWSAEQGAERAAEQVTPLVAANPNMPLVVAGFSQGAGLACRLAQSGAVDPLGLVLLAPSFNTFGLPLHIAGRPRPPLWVSVGTQDHHHQDAVDFAWRCAKFDVPCRVYEHAGGHGYPEDLASLFADAIDWFREPAA